MKVLKKFLVMIVMASTGIFLISCGIGGVLLSGTKDVENRLYEAIAVNNLEAVNEALNDGADIDNFSGRLPRDSNPLWHAFKHSPSKRIPEHLIEKGADVNIPQDGSSLLGWMAVNCDVHFCELLIKHGAKVDYEEKNGNTPLEDVLDYGTRATCIEKNINDIVTLMLDNGAKIRPESLVAVLRGIQSRSSKFNYLVKRRVLEGLIKEGYKSGLDPVLEAALLGKSDRVAELIKAGKMQTEDEVRIAGYTDPPSNIPRSETNETTYGEHILYATAAFGSVETMKLLAQKGFDLKYKDGGRVTLLMVASNYGNLDMVKYLLSQGGDKEFRTGDKTALYFAVENNQYDVAEYLIKMGADIKPYKLDFVGSIDVFDAAWENGNAKMMKLILDSGYKSDKSVEECLFINALKSGDAKELKKFSGYSYKGFDYTAALATYRSKIETIRFLVENGAKVNSPEGDEVMLSAAAEGNTDIVEYLISQGANVNAVAIGTDGEVKDKKINSTLYNAIIRGNLDIIKLLIENGADIEQELDFSEGTEAPVLTAAGCSSKNILEYFLKKGAKVNYQNNKGNSPLMRAAYAGRIDNLKLLLSYKADKQLKDNNGHTAMDLAKEKKQKEIVDYLEKQK
ncbi:ankyrin repeat protein [Ruminiclostridium hungatei]|uniref:Ankyrin repeat protein n=1 Tax=Ruminiclostridium hungatei TaxID=48256 RepID=A0A1V4SJS4_RUMHU|nr:ankyrin repeat domain-containing protein [Ruminiclostridium hungatei]OPX44033.1 ankyrin repeat protein [Ruminiclostridium hungatei]